ncbi:MULTISPECIES: sterol desaturase family protein [unclassified Paraburkholderia]|uniref:sterol desaturase family protein n=1 Tax=unclassified Paraburkholderia TaxID=2615204 RepID=UPI002AB0CA13|nr:MULTISPECIES: sterol desaturase family protein [unclassified Paraburkholderia]
MNIAHVPFALLASMMADYSLMNAIHYLAFVIPAFALLAWVSRKPIRFGRGTPPRPGAAQLWREAWLSTSTIVLGAAMGPLIMLAGMGPKLNFYSGIDTYGWGYFFFSIVLMMVVRDTMFYWEHRLLHHRSLFRFTHRAHHLSIQPNPLTAFAVHPLEAIIGAVIPYLIILFFVPKHQLAYMTFLWIDAAVGVVTHLGVEFLPRGFSRSRIGRWIGTTTAHQMHHEFSRCNYGLYFLFWDRVMGTLHKRYDDVFDSSSPSRRGRERSAQPAPARQAG